MRRSLFYPVLCSDFSLEQKQLPKRFQRNDLNEARTRQRVVESEQREPLKEIENPAYRCEAAARGVMPASQTLLTIAGMSIAKRYLRYLINCEPLTRVRKRAVEEPLPKTHVLSRIQDVNVIGIRWPVVKGGRIP